MKKTPFCPLGLCLFLFWLLQPLHSSGQEFSGQDLLISQTDEEQNTALSELITEQEKLDIDINECSASTLSSLSFLLPEYVDAILAHREKFGPFASVYELQTVQGLPRRIAKLLYPYTSCTPYKCDARYGSEENQNLLAIRVERALIMPTDPDTISAIAETPWAVAVRSRIYIGKQAQIGVFLEKDAGEPFLWRGNYNQSKIQKLTGFDQAGVTVIVSNVHKRLPFILTGAYSLCLGQGLLVWQGFPLGKGASSMAIQKLAPVFMPKFSPSEGQNMHGLATKYLITKHLHGYIFASLKSNDAIITSDSLRESQTFSALDLDGYHRTEAEMANRNTLQMGQYGLRLHQILPFANVGVNAMYTHFSIPLVRSQALYRQFLFAGDRLLQTSADYRIQTGQFSLFGEHAISSNAASAHLAGLQMSLHRTMDICFYLRHFSRNYQTLTGNTPGESSLPINENGMYAGLEWRPSTQCIINAYSDVWNHPWAGYQRSGPAIGHDFLVRLLWRKKRWGEAYVQYKKEVKLTDSDALFSTPLLIPQQTSHLRAHIQFMLAAGWQWRCRAEWSFFRSEEKQKGFLLFQDVIYKSPESGWSVTARMAFFNIDGFGARIYNYEHDVLFTASIPFLQGEGTRCYILLRKKWRKIGSTELRWSVDKIQNTGNEAWSNRVTNTVKSELTLQWSQRF